MDASSRSNHEIPEIGFQLSLLRLAAPGDSPSSQVLEVEELLAAGHLLAR